MAIRSYRMLGVSLPYLLYLSLFNYSNDPSLPSDNLAPLDRRRNLEAKD